MLSSPSAVWATKPPCRAKPRPLLARRRRSLRQGTVMLPGSNGMPLPGFQHHVAGRLGIGSTRHGNRVKPPGDHALERHGVQPPLIRRHASRRNLPSVLGPPEPACDYPPPSVPLHHDTGARQVGHGQACEQEPCNRLLAARWSALLGIDSNDLDRGPSTSRPAGPMECHPLDRDLEGDLPRRPVELTRQRDRHTAFRTRLVPFLPSVTWLFPVANTPMALHSDNACRLFSRPTLQRLQKPLVKLPCLIRHVHDKRIWTALLDLARPLIAFPPPGMLFLCRGVAVALLCHGLLHPPLEHRYGIIDAPAQRVRRA
jgi:hypothetical protein